MNGKSNALVVAFLSLALASGCANPQKKALEQAKQMEQMEQANLATFDDLDFNVYSGQKWDELSRSHSKDVTVHWPDGRTTHGLETHVEDLKAIFVFAPDTRIKEHPVKIASGDWTAVSGTMEGTFSQPMPLGGGKSLPPTGKKFRLPMATIGHWKDGVMDEEWLYWDNLAFMQQIGVVQ